LNIFALKLGVEIVELSLHVYLSFDYIRR